MATKKNPFEDKPYSEPDTRQSKAAVPAATIPTTAPSKYVPQQYNKATGKVEDIKRTGTTMSRSAFEKTDFDKTDLKNVPLTSGQEVINKLQPQQSPAFQNIGQLDPNIVGQLNDPLTQDILANLQGTQDMAQGLTYNGTAKENLVRNSQYLATRLATPGIKILNRISKDAKLGDAIAADLGVNKEAERILKSYSTEDNIKNIRDNIVNSEALQAKALQQAKTNPVQAALNYEEAQSRKYKSLRQLKAISQYDPKMWIEIRDDITKLETYFDTTRGIKAMDDDAMRMALNME